MKNMNMKNKNDFYINKTKMFDHLSRSILCNFFLTHIKKTIEKFLFVWTNAMDGALHNNPALLPVRDFGILVSFVELPIFGFK